MHRSEAKQPNATASSPIGLDETVYAIDYDGVVGHVRNTANLFAEAVSAEDPSMAELMLRERELSEASAGSFDCWGFLASQENVTRSKLDSFEASFNELASQRGPESLLYDDAEDFIATMASSGLRFFLMTHGGDKWQTMKLAASGVVGKVPYLITSKKEKGQTIASWRHPVSGLYVCQGITDTEGNKIEINGHRIVLLDDKASSFDGFPPDHDTPGLFAHGYHLLRAGEIPKPKQLGPVPSNVTRIHTPRAFVEIEGIAA